jgi:hypothetical protein
VVDCSWRSRRTGPAVRARRESGLAARHDCPTAVQIFFPDGDAPTVLFHIAVR